MSYLLLTGVGSNGRVSCPDSAALDLVSNITITVYAEATDWSAAGSQRLVAKRSGNTGYYLNLATTGLLQFVIGDGTTQGLNASTATGFTDGVGTWIEAFYDATAKTTRFRKSSDPVNTAIGSITWTTINTSAAHAAGATAINAVGLAIGAESPSGGFEFAGKIYKVQVQNDVGTIVASPDFSSLVNGTPPIIDAQGNVFSYSGNAVIAGGPVTDDDLDTLLLYMD